MLLCKNMYKIVVDQVIKNIDVAAGVRIITNIYMNSYWEETNNKQFNKRHQQDFKIWYGVIICKTHQLKSCIWKRSNILTAPSMRGNFKPLKHILVCNVCQAFNVLSYIEKCGYHYPYFHRRQHALCICTSIQGQLIHLRGILSRSMWLRIRGQSFKHLLLAADQN